MAFLAVFSCRSEAQVWDSTFLYVRTIYPECYPLSDSVIAFTATGNATLNAIFAANSVTAYVRLGKWSAIDSFNQSLSISYTTSSLNLINDLEASGLFYHIKSFSVKQADLPTLDCTPLNNDPWTDFRNDTIVSDDWHFDETELYCAWDISKGDSEVKVAFMDVGFDSNHYDLGSIKHVVKYTAMSPSSGVHGSGTTSILAASENSKGIVGAAPNVSTSIYELPGGNNNIDVRDLEAIIEEAVNDGVKIINMSFAASYIPIARYQEWIDRGVLFVASAGNKPYNRNWGAESALNGFMVVSSTRKGGNFFSQHAYNEFVEICAPGAGIWQCSSDSELNSLQEAWGTSSAAPQVAAAAALMLSVNPTMSPASLECALKSTAETILNEHPDSLFYGKIGSGKLNTFKAVQYAQSLLAPSTIPSFVNSRMTITGTHFIPNTIYIADGGQLILSNATITFAQSAGIAVSAGGVLNISNSKLTAPSGCNYFWNGITVSGDGLGNAGRITMNNNSVIESAYVGIRVSNYAFLRQGGSVQAANSQFINCPTGVEVIGTILNASVKSFLTDCTFEWTKPYVFTGNVNHHIKLTQKSDFGVYSCDFRNTLPVGSFNEEGGRGIGMSTYNSDFEVMPTRNPMNPCTVQGDGCSFVGLEYGIVVSNSNRSPNNFNKPNIKTARIYNSSFINTKHGLDFYLDSRSVIFENSFVWDNAFKMIHASSLNNVGLFYGIQNTESWSAQVINNSMQFLADENVIDWFVGDIHVNEGRMNLLGPNFEAFNLSTAQNNYLSSDFNINSVGNMHSYYTPTVNGGSSSQINTACNIYSENLTKGIYLDHTAKTIGTASIGYGFLGETYLSANDFGTCQNAQSTGVSHLSIDNQSAFSKIMMWYDISKGAYPIDSLCHSTNVEIKPDLNSRPLPDNCGAGAYFFAPNSVYCPGADGFPGTFDEHEGESHLDYPQTNGGSTGIYPPDEGPAGENGDTDNNEVVEMLGYKAQDLYDVNKALEYELISLFDEGDTAYKKPVQMLLSHFYGVNRHITVAKPEVQDLYDSKPALVAGESNDDTAPTDNVQVYQLYTNMYKLSSADATWHLVYATDYLGKLLATNAIVQAEDKLSTVAVPPGVYMLHLQNSRGNLKTVKIMVQ